MVKSKAERRDYSADDKAAALALVKMNSGNVTATAKQLGIPEPTLRSWVKNQAEDPDPDLELYANRKLGSIAEKFTNLIHRITDAVTPQDIQKASLTAKMTSVGILTDKLRVIDQPESDPTAELCRLLNIHRSQLPASLDLPDDFQLPSGFLLGPQSTDIEVSAIVRDDDPIQPDLKVNPIPDDSQPSCDAQSQDIPQTLTALGLISGFPHLAPNGLIVSADYLSHREHSAFAPLDCLFCSEFHDIQDSDQWPLAARQIEAILEALPNDSDDDNSALLAALDLDDDDLSQ